MGDGRGHERRAQHIPARPVAAPVAARGNGQAASKAQSRALRREPGNAAGGKKRKHQRQGTRVHCDLLREEVSLAARASVSTTAMFGNSAWGRPCRSFRYVELL